MEDVTIEDEFDSNEELLSKSELKPNLISSIIFQIVNQPWIILLIGLFIVGTYFYIKKNRRQNSTVASNNKRDDSFNQYDQMSQIRERQQKAYEEQSLRYAEQKKAKAELLKTNVDEKPKPLRYRSDDHNPLTGQSTRGSGDSCGWRPSSKRKPAGG